MVFDGEIGQLTKIYFGVDSSTEMGSGHLMRCLTLGNRLRDDGATIAFISRDLPGNLSEFATAQGFPVHHCRPLGKSGKRQIPQSTRLLAGGGLAGGCNGNLGDSGAG